MNMILNAQSPPSAYLSFLDSRPFRVYIKNGLGRTLPLQLSYVESETYSQVCESIKTYWKSSQHENHSGTPIIIITSEFGVVVHSDNWAAFIANRGPCIVWWGSESINRFVSEICDRKEVLINKQMEQLRVTEAVIPFAKEFELHTDNVSIAELPGSTVIQEVQQESQRWGLLNHLETSEYAAAVEQANNSSSILNSFSQEEELKGFLFAGPIDLSDNTLVPM